MSTKVKCTECPSKPAFLEKNAVLCPSCKSFYHATCANIISKLPNGAFASCCGIKHNTPKAADQAQAGAPVTQQQLIDIINRSNKDQSEQLGKMLKNELKLLSDKIDNVADRVSNLEDQIGSHGDRIDRIEVDIQALTPSSQESLLYELHERVRREKNVIFFNVPESDESANNDRTKIIDLLAEAPFNLQLIHTTRLGRKSVNSNTVRPLKVFFQTCDEAIWVLKNSKDFVDKNISCKRDRTPSERAHLKQLYAELDDRKKEGESNLIIKYINNIPRIMAKN
ncbi:hypothetical protein QAD02_006338 [Eretmocerus hayati]|uniref:Uncharacterized protein n=1 Tax=Eretmocerus hayati TaxID=131215 RepID=A0ACC2N1Q8_9HYME|nr:hypothetical protein QAD02_006338 [Eretmocerus hayati]